MKRYRKQWILIILTFFLLTSIAALYLYFPKADSWYVTSYSDDSGNQGMFYTLYNPASEQLILIDGGWAENAEHVRQVIHKYGDHVTAWIITHYHNDHVDAFNSVFADPQGIIIDAVYDSPIDYATYLSVAREWDSPNSYTQYLEVTKNASNIHPIVRGEKVKIAGLDFEFFNTYDEKISQVNDIPNNASLVFRVSNHHDSMLFTADCHSLEIAKLILADFQDELRADYYQAPHHGNSENWEIMCETVKPSYVFLDGPTWLMEGENYRAKDLIQYCKDHNIAYGTYLSSPNTIILK